MNINRGYENASLEWGDFPWKEDPHRCGDAPFVPQVMADGTQNSCGSYCDGFNKEGCNKYRPNYPDDEYLQQFIRHGGDCNEFNDCKNNKSLCNGKECDTGLNFRIQNNTLEHFGFSSEVDMFNLLLWLIIIFIGLKMIYCGCK